MMVNDDKKHDHPTHDEALSNLAKVPGAIGNFIRAYPGVQIVDETKWLEDWFENRIEKYYYHTFSRADEIIIPEITATPSGDNLIARPIRIIAIQPHYFRGFRDTSEAINLEGDLVVIDGRNTSGKTSLAEAMEWLFTGSLSRRESMDLGSPHELENCISNQFRPEQEETWVKATFIDIEEKEPKTFTLCRVLKEDYGNTSTSKCASILFFDENQLTTREEMELLDRLFASEPPLLMQHTLRLFVENNPKKRRGYFERLLHLDELTNLIGKAVIGESRKDEFPSPTHSVALKLWDSLGSILQAEQSKRLYRQVIRSEDDAINKIFTNALARISNCEFPLLVKDLNKIKEIEDILYSEQRKYRQQTYPLLTRMRPLKQLPEDQYQPIYDSQQLQDIITNFREAWKSCAIAQAAAESIGNDKLTISRALKILFDESIIQEDIEEQICPICAYDKTKTLTKSRIQEIEKWLPTQEAKAKAIVNLKKTKQPIITLIQKLINEYNELLPALPSEKDITKSLLEAEIELQKSVQNIQSVKEQANELFKAVIQQAEKVISEANVVPNSADDCEQTIKQLLQITKGLEKLPVEARLYRDAFRAVEVAVGATASIDPAYRLRAAWLQCSENISAIVDDLKWEQSKRNTIKDLEIIRDSLIEYRKAFLETRRVSFSNEVDLIWKTLRGDLYSSFCRLHIPPPSGRGFPIEIEIKATLDDGSQKKEVDALRVFSESQVNALGIAAFITRSKLLGHKLLILDDPVQSMDDEHFKTFAECLLTYILDNGFQVIILTHNDKFARDISVCHFDRDNYVTMSVRLSRRQGCVIQEGNRRFSERLRLAEKQIDEGRIKNAWELLREAIERLYLVTYKKYGPSDFNPDSWQNQTAEYMFDHVGSIIEAKCKGAGQELKCILDMSTAGAHDIPPRGETDLRKSITFLNSLPGILRVGG